MAAFKAVARLVALRVGWSFLTPAYAMLLDHRGDLGLQGLDWWLLLVAYAAIGVALSTWGVAGIIHAFERADRMERAIDTFSQTAQPIFEANRRAMERRDV